MYSRTFITLASWLSLARFSFASPVASVGSLDTTDLASPSSSSSSSSLTDDSGNFGQWADQLASQASSTSSWINMRLATIDLPTLATTVSQAGALSSIMVGDGMAVASGIALGQTSIHYSSIQLCVPLSQATVPTVIPSYTPTASVDYAAITTFASVPLTQIEAAATSRAAQASLTHSTGSPLTKPTATGFASAGGDQTESSLTRSSSVEKFLEVSTPLEATSTETSSIDWNSVDQWRSGSTWGVQSSVRSTSTVSFLAGPNSFETFSTQTRSSGTHLTNSFPTEMSSWAFVPTSQASATNIWNESPSRTTFATVSMTSPAWSEPSSKPWNETSALLRRKVVQDREAQPVDAVEYISPPNGDGDLREEESSDCLYPAINGYRLMRDAAGLLAVDFSSQAPWGQPNNEGSSGQASQQRRSGAYLGLFLHL